MFHARRIPTALLASLTLAACASGAPGASTPGVTTTGSAAPSPASPVATPGTTFVPPALRTADGIPVPSTRAERTGYRETSTHQDVTDFVSVLRSRGAPLEIRELARSAGGRIVPLVIASRPRVTSPAAARALGRPIVYVQANIHAGEVEGKEAILALLRDWSYSATPNVLDSLVLLVVPIYNADGNERLGPQARNRPQQNGPENVGEGDNAMGLNLNRDYVKAEAPETRGTLAAFNAWDPDVFMDLHTTNGSYHGYALTYSPSLHPAAPLGLYTADTLLPELRRRMRARHGLETFPYGNFATNAGETISPSEGGAWRTYEHKGRFGTNYYGLRGRISILSEAYSHDPFERRVASTRAFVQEALSLVAEGREGIRARIARGTEASTFTVGNRAPVPVSARFDSRPGVADVLVELLEPRDTLTAGEPGVPRALRRTGRIVTRRMPLVDRFEGVIRQVPTLEGYVFDRSWTDVALLLRTHGVSVIQLERPMTANLQLFDVDSVRFADRPFQGHREATVTGRWRDTSRVLGAGTFFVRMATPRDLLAMQLLEPESDDGLLTWNAFDSVLARGKEAPVARLTAPLRLYSPGRSASPLR